MNDALPAPASPCEIRAPFGGMVTLLVAPGDHVASGDVLAVLEAMKMEAPVTAPHAGTVAEIHPGLQGDEACQVSGGDLIVSLT